MKNADLNLDPISCTPLDASRCGGIRKALKLINQNDLCSRLSGNDGSLEIPFYIIYVSLVEIKTVTSN